jgi:FKBP-type peptidyl-prolyl cis-trans isomerase FkpA
MRAVLFFLPVVLMAQGPAPKPQAAKPKPAVRSAAPKPGAAKAKPKPQPASTPTPVTDEDKTVYSVGLSIARSLERLGLSPKEVALVQRAIADGLANKPAVDLTEWGPKIDGLKRARATQAAEREKAASKAYLEKAAAEPGAVKTESGLVYRELTPGTGASPKATDTVKVNYRGTLINGTEFDSSYKRNEPAQFALNQVIRCWTEGVQKMKVGGKSLLACPSDLAYGDAGRPTIPGGATLIFEIELLDITTATK